ncbi:unnamed protein product [Closterium sp. NIES-65]|nr:unnamed protein product [Closterium sp. NIES-65]
MGVSAPLPPFQAPRGPFAAPLPPFQAPSPPFSRPVAALPGPSRPLRGPVAAPIGPVDAASGPVANPSGPVAAPIGPVAAASGPVAAASGSVADPSGPVAAPIGPVIAASGPVVAASGPVAASSGPVAATCGPGPAPAMPHGLSLFDLTSGASPAPPATTDSTVRSQWATRNAAARLAVRRHLPTTERAHFSQYKSAQTLYDAVVARYSSPATAALSRLMLPYLFLDLAAFPKVADLITHLRTSDTRYRAALPAEVCAKNPLPPMYITLYYIVTRLPDSLRVVRDHFLSVCPTTLTVDLLEKGLLAAGKSIVAVGASRGDPRTPVFEGCSPSPLLPSIASVAAADLVGFYGVSAASAPSGRRRIGKGKGGKGAGGAIKAGGGDGGGSGGGGGVVVGVVAGVATAVAAVEAEEVAVAAEGAEVAEAAVAEAAGAEVAAAVELVATMRRGVGPAVVRASSSNAVVRPYPLSSFVNGTLRVSAMGVLVPALTSSVPATALVSSAVARTPPSAASAA